jgi:zinc transport system permease protein
MIVLEYLQQPFFRNAIIAGLLVAGLCSYLGVYVVLKRIVFVGAALAQISSAGVALALLLGFSPIFFSLLFSILGIALFSLIPFRKKIPMEGIIGVSYVCASALGVLFVAKNPVGEARALSFLFGNILTVPKTEIALLIFLTFGIGLIHYLFYKEFILVSFDYEMALAQKIPARFWDLLLYITLGLTIAFSIKSAGILIVSAFLVIPAITARLTTNKIKRIFALAILFGALATLLGLYLSVIFDLPSGSAIVATSAGILILIAGFNLLKDLPRHLRISLVFVPLGLSLLLPLRGVAAETPSLQTPESASLPQQPLPQQPSRPSEGSLQTLDTGPSQPPLPQPSQQRTGFFQSLNPDIRVEVNFIGNKTFTGEGPGLEAEILRNRFNLKELELGLQASVDPYARADVFFSGENLLGEESQVSLEEAWLTLIRLPLGAQARIGKFRSLFGEINDRDPAEFPFVDRPLVLTNFFGDDGDIETGIVSNFVIPNPWDVHMLFWLGIYNGDNEIAFHGGEARKPAYFSRFEVFQELGPATGFEVGTAVMTGVNDPEGEFRTTLENIHFELEWKHPVLSQYKSFDWVGEIFLSQREGIQGTEDSIGLYTFAQYQLSRRWFIGGRYDYSQLPTDSNSREWAISGIFSFKPSRFSTVRVQYKHIDRNFDENVEEVFFQFRFVIGFERPEPF